MTILESVLNIIFLPYDAIFEYCDIFVFVDDNVPVSLYVCVCGFGCVLRVMSTVQLRFPFKVNVI